MRDTLLLVEHPPVFTLGRLQSCEANVRVTREEIEAAGASVVQSERGGNVTFHGPGQLVAYPILDLNGHRKDMRWFVRSLEDAMIATAAAFGVTARRGVAGEEGVLFELLGLFLVGLLFLLVNVGECANCSDDASPHRGFLQPL